MKKALIRTAQAIFTIAILIYLFNSPEKRAQMGAAFSRADGYWMVVLWFFGLGLGGIYNKLTLGAAGC